jgi:Bacterial low temperature requirement A protein (LtrA)
MQSIVVVASEFSEYQTPTLEHYSFVGAACLMFFCIKLLYVDDADTRAEDHALLVNRYAAFWFNVGQYCLLLSTTVMGSGLDLLTHDYMASSAALPGPAKSLVTGGFASVLLSTFFIKSMHLKRVPTDRLNQALFVGAYVIQGIVLLAIVGISFAMSLDLTAGGILEYLMQTNIQLLFTLSGAALFLVVMSWLDEGVELALYKTASTSRAYRIHPFGMWWCLKPDISSEDISSADLEQIGESTRRRSSTARFSVLSPLLGSSLAEFKDLRSSSYQSVSTAERATLNV